MSDFLEDGYTEQGYVEPEDGIHGALEFEYRPAVGRLADPITGLIQGQSPQWDRWWDAVAKALAIDPKLLQSWSLKDGRGNPVQITAANIQRTKQLLIHKVWLIVAGQRASDLRPDGTQAKKPDLEADAKNSQQG